MLLDNVTTVLLMAPITITLCEDLDLNPVPILMAIVVHANIGGTTTPVGDPANIIITSNPTILESVRNLTPIKLNEKQLNRLLRLLHRA
jgi:P protein